MAKRGSIKNVTCDRCGNPINLSNDMVRDFINKQYADKDICEDCDLTITLHKSTTANDLINNQPLGTTAKQMLDRYQ